MNATKVKVSPSRGSIIISTFQSRKSASKIAKEMISRKSVCMRKHYQNKFILLLEGEDTI